jgi:hypothetical protein
LRCHEPDCYGPCFLLFRTFLSLQKEPGWTGGDVVFRIVSAVGNQTNGVESAGEVPMLLVG